MSDEKKVSTMVDKMLSPEQKAEAERHLANTEAERANHVKGEKDWLETQRKLHEQHARGEPDISTGKTD